MIKSLLKWMFITAIILLAGQIRVGKKTMAEKFQSIVTQICAAGSRELRRSKVFKQMEHHIHFPSWMSMEETQNQIAEQQGSVHNRLAPVQAGEDISSSDRESLLRLLQ